MADDYGRTALCLAARRKSPSIVRLLLRHGADINGRSSGTDSYYLATNYVRPSHDQIQLLPLHAWACEDFSCSATFQDFEDTAIALMEAGCDVNSHDSDGKTALFNWSTHQDGQWASALIRILIEHGADVSAVDDKGNTPLHVTSWKASDTTMKILFDAGGDFNAHRKSDGQTPLMRAINGRCGQLPSDWAEWVHKYRVDPNAVDSDGKTVLHHVLCGDMWTVRTVKQWIQAGADPQVQDHLGQTCCFEHSAVYDPAEEKEKLLPLLQAAGLDINHRDRYGRSVILDVLRCPNMEVLKHLQNHGADLTTRDSKGKTGLHMLASREVSHCSTSSQYLEEQTEYLKLFINAGVDPNTTDHEGNTFLHDAVTNTGRDASTTRLLLQTALAIGADPTTRNHRGRSILHHIAAAPSWDESGQRKSDSEDRLDDFLPPRMDLDVNLMDHDGVTALHLAASRSAVRVCKLLQAGADLTATDHNRRAALHYAAIARNGNALGILADAYRARSLPIDQSDHNCRTALHNAVRSGVPESVHILLEYAADPHIKDIRQRTVLHIISESMEENDIWRLARSSERYRHLQLSNSSCGKDEAKANYKFLPSSLDFVDPLRPLPRRFKDAEPEQDAGVLDDHAQGIRRILHLLLQTQIGIDASAIDVEGKTAVDVAMQFRCGEVLQGLSHVLQETRPSSLVAAAMCDSGLDLQRQGAQLFVRELREVQELNTERLDPATATALLATEVCFANEDVVEKLLVAGADPLAARSDGKTVMHAIAKYGLVSSMERVLETFGNGRYQALLSQDLIHEAAERSQSNIEMIKLLVRNGVDLNAKRETGAE